MPTFTPLLNLTSLSNIVGWILPRDDCSSVRGSGLAGCHSFHVMAYTYERYGCIHGLMFMLLY